MIEFVIKLAACVFAVFGATGAVGTIAVEEVPCRYQVQWHAESGGYYQWFCDGNCRKGQAVSPCYEWSGTIGGVTYTWCDCAFGVSAACDVWRISNTQWNCLDLGCGEQCDKPPADGRKHYACLCP